VRPALGRGELARRTWVIPDNAYVLADQVYYCQTPHAFKARFDHLMDQMAVPEPAPDGEKILLVRSKRATRHVLNDDELAAVARSYGFRPVDTAGMTVDEQIQLMQGARYLIAVHGAGMINMIFRRNAPLSVLELHPAGYQTGDFGEISRQFAYRYDTLACQPDRSFLQHANMTVPIDQLRQGIERMLAAAPAPVAGSLSA
jgi:capsular polysaccharide biosynthesis protein